MTDPTGRVELGDVVAAFVALRNENSRVLQALADDHRITLTDLRAVSRLHDTADATPKALGAFLDLTQGSVTALVDRIERAGFVTRQPHPSDRRSLLLRLTDEGTAVAETANSVYERAFAAAIQTDEFSRVHGTFTRVAEALRQHGRSEDAGEPGAKTA